MNLALLIPFAVFGAFLLIGLSIYARMSRPDLQRRLDALRADKNLTMEERLKKPLFERSMLPMVDKVATMIKGFSKQESMEKLQHQLVQAGMFPKWTATRYNALCWVCGFGLAVGIPLLNTLSAAAGSAGSGQGFGVKSEEVLDSTSLLIYIGALVIGFYGPRVMLGQKIRQRQTQLLRSLPAAIDLIAISAEAGLGFDQAMAQVRRQTGGPLADELGVTLNEIRLGKPRIEALNQLAYRTGVDDIKIFVGAVVQSFQLGTSIVETLRVQADSIRIKQRQRAQEQAMKAPVKMMFPLVFFIFPALLVVILGPAVINIMTSMK